MAPELFERFRHNEIPTLPGSVQRFMDDRFGKMMEEVAGSRPLASPDFEEVYQELTSDRARSDMPTIALACYLTSEIEDLVFNRIDSEDDERSLRFTEVKRRDHLEEVLEYGEQCVKWAEKNDKNQLYESGRAYSPRTVAMLVAHGIRKAFDFNSTRQVKDLRRLLKVPPAYRKYTANRA